MTEEVENLNEMLSRTLRIDKLSRNITDNHLRDIFSTYGEVESISVQIDSKVKLSLGWAFVEFKQRKGAENAYTNMHNAQMDGKNISIKFKPLDFDKTLPPISVSIHTTHQREKDNTFDKLNEKELIKEIGNKAPPPITRVATDVFAHKDKEKEKKK
eukprot:738245_1